MNIIKRTLPTILIATGALALSMTAGAVAGTVITGRQIADNTVTSADVKNRSLKSRT